MSVNDPAADEADGLAWDMWRSQPMQQFKFCIPRAYGRAIMCKLIESEAIEFTEDPFIADGKLFLQDLHECAECDRKLRYLVSEVNRYLEDDASAERAAIVFGDQDWGEPADLGSLNVQGLDTTISDLNSELSELEAEFSRNDFAMREITLKSAIKREHRLVAEHSARFLESVTANDTSELPNPGAPEDMEAGVVALTAQNGEPDHEFTLLNLCGVVLAERTEKLRHALFRVCYGKVIVKLEPLPEPMVYARTGRLEAHCMLIVLFTTEDIRERIAKICHVFDAHLYDVSATSMEQVAGYLEFNELTESEIEGVDLVVNQTLQANLRNCHRVAIYMKQWAALVRRELILITLLNRCNSSAEYLYIRGWVPDVFMNRVSAALEGDTIQGSGLLEKVEQSFGPGPVAPTFIPTSKYTDCLQGVVDKYGIARYRELNPGLFALVFFPFLFGVMFGDILHGLIMIIFAIVMIFFEEKLAEGHSEVVDMIFAARWLTLQRTRPNAQLGTKRSLNSANSAAGSNK